MYRPEDSNTDTSCRAHWLLRSPHTFALPSAGGPGSPATPFSSTIFPIFLSSAHSVLLKQRPKCRMSSQSSLLKAPPSLYEEFSWSPFLKFRLRLERAKRRERKEVTPLQEHSNGPQANSPMALAYSPSPFSPPTDGGGEGPRVVVVMVGRILLLEQGSNPAVRYGAGVPRAPFPSAEGLSF